MSPRAHAGSDGKETEMLQQLGKTAIQIVETALSVVGVRVGTEEPPHTVEPLIQGVEIRRYGPRIAAETRVSGDEIAARSEGFRRLARYIFGANGSSDTIAMTAPVGDQKMRQSTKIAMTAPVAQSQSAQESLIRFYMPAEWTMESLPTPIDDRVALRAVAPETVAVLRFSGDRGARSVATHTAKLREVLRSTGFEAAGEPTCWFYDPPWTLWFLRRNEIAIPIVDRNAVIPGGQ
jgi:SOUL heme-binding protein